MRRPQANTARNRISPGDRQAVGLWFLERELWFLERELQY
jgi:hypothetical protein